ncbi:rod shape-determining protein MreD [Acinetobacter rathckeae]|uniref:rod shape-determining protein MreD n=1 Tax=Acinetobacter rathckeae TaxID=2605272 RepID=UPI0018A2A0D9|nr:rod shape-determining protein MreD [Acinetobacter rathckeae]MBF7688655.1 rod shape-determining protein MreD [Acinetobacter rathckeae]MBF7695901.1 rod shape-determining protein MreD [Acinetobacter rathckeae]
MLIAKYKPLKRKDPLLLIVLTVILASVMTIYPLSYDISAWRPFILMLVMLFWVLCQPTWCGVWFAFGLGIFFDLLIDAPLGQNASAFVLIAFITRYFIREKRILTFLNLWFISILATVGYVLFVWLLQTLGNVDYPLMRRWPPIVSSLLCWPLLYYSLKTWRL